MSMLHVPISPKVACSNLGFVEIASTKQENSGSSSVLSNHSGLELGFECNILLSIARQRLRPESSA